MSPVASTYIPDFVARVDGLTLPAKLRAAVTSVRFDESIEGSDRVELQLADPSLLLEFFALLDIGVRIDLELGYRPDRLSHVFAGDVTGVEPSFPSSGMPSVTVTAHDFMSRLHQGTKTRGFSYELTDSIIASIIAAENGLIAVPDVAASSASALALLEERPRYQFKQSDHDFLRAVAAEWGFDMWVDGDFLNFKLLQPLLPPPEVALRWGESLFDFTPRLTSIGQVAGVSARVWVEARKTQIEIAVSFDGARLSVKVAPTVFGQAAQTSATLSLPDLPFDAPVDAVKWALGEMRRRVNTRVTGRGSTVGDPRLRVGRTLSIEQVGPRFSGPNYRLTSVSHTFNAGGYRTSFEARQEVA